MQTQGFEIPLHQSAIKAQLVMGLPRQLALVLYTIVVALTLPLSTWYAIPPGLFLHAVFAAAARRDPAFWDVFRRAVGSRLFYRA
jgi:type IV secretory pathway TrbD component